MKKSRILVLCLLITSMVLAGCGGNSNAPATTAAGAGNVTTPASENTGGNTTSQNAPTENTSVKDTLVFGLSSEPISLDPLKTTDQMSWDNWISLYDTLFWYNKDTGGVENRLAESFSWDSTNTELTVKVKEGVLFHNGQEMKAEDVAYSIDRIARGTYTAMYAVNFDHVEVVDEYSIKIYYTNPFEGALKTLAVLGFSIVPKDVVEKDVDAFALNPIGTGPYKFVSRTTGVQIVYEANENYWRGKPAIKNLIYRIFTDVNTAVVALEAGEVDLLTHAPLTSKNEISNNPNVVWDEDRFYGPTFVCFQQEPGQMFSDINLRKAVQYGLRTDDILLGAADGIGMTIKGMSLPGMVGYDENYEGVPYDLEKAKEYMRAAGYAEGDGPTITIATIDTVVYYKSVDIIASQLMELGFKVTVERVERSAYFANVFDKSEFTLVNTGWGVMLPDADFVFGLSHSSQIGVGYNFSRINDPKVDDLIIRGRNEPDTVKRGEIYKELQQYYNDQAIFVPIMMYGAGVAYNKDLKGVKPDILYRFEIFDYHFE